MGTNYYWQAERCEHCGRGGESLHIGKSSGGWCFSLHVIPEEGIHGLDDWKERWKTGVILDEYDQVVQADDMLGIITDRANWAPKDPDAFDYERNHAEQGPFGLIRSRVDGYHCIGHGEGTWDLVATDFS